MPDIEIDFMETSKKMIGIAQKRTLPMQVNFICEDIRYYQTEKKYDAVLSFFFLDLFYTTESKNVTIKLMSFMPKNGLWLLADFQKSKKLTNKWMLTTMYLFFRIVSKVQVMQLPDIPLILEELSIHPYKYKLFSKKFICSYVIKK